MNFKSFPIFEHEEGLLLANKSTYWTAFFELLGYKSFVTVFDSNRLQLKQQP